MIVRCFSSGGELLMLRDAHSSVDCEASWLREENTEANSIGVSIQATGGLCATKAFAVGNHPALARSSFPPSDLWIGMLHE